MRGRGRFRLALGLLVGTLLAVPGLAAADAPTPLAEQVLRRALAADDRQSYTGTMVLYTWATGRGDATVVRVRHRAPGQSRLEYLGAGQEPYLIIVDDGTHRWHYHPEDGTAFVGASQGRFSDAPDQSLSLLRHNYHLQPNGTGEIAGRLVDVVELVPRGCGRPAQRFWVDRETGVILRTEQYRLDGSLAALTVFTAFTPARSLPDETFRLRLAKEVRVTAGEAVGTPLQSLRERSGVALRLPAELPPGYVFDSASLSQTGREKGVHLRFTDGLGVISLFQQTAEPLARYRLEGAQAVALRSGRGWLREQCGGYVLNWTADGVNFTLVGEVPASVLVRIADSIPPGPGALAQVRQVFLRLLGREE
jgi:sigma-E factor negative regulatory protein RseB